MKRITLPKILHALQAMEHRVELDAETSGRARRALERMLAVGRREPRERRERPENREIAQ
jgi:quinolinate synthase